MRTIIPLFSLDPIFNILIDRRNSSRIRVQRMLSGDIKSTSQSVVASE